MILAPLLGAALILAVADEPFDNANGTTKLTAREKIAATEPLIQSATDCIIHAVAANPDYGKPTAQLGDLIVASMPTCVTPVRAMIDAYDRYFGDGTGEAFFMGPYLDVLPKAVVNAENKAAD